MQYEYRVTKYDPRNRDEKGVYTVDEWIMFSQVGSVVGGKQLTMEEYQRTEDAYIAAAVSFLKESGSQSVAVRQLEDTQGEAKNLSVREGCILDHEQAASLMRLVLRGLAWCKLESENGYVHFGWDYYMFIAVPIRCDSSREFASRQGLHVENCPSPHGDRS